MSDAEFIALVSKMRTAQTCYFKTRSQYDLRCARDYERRVDAELNRRAKEKRSAQGTLH